MNENEGKTLREIALREIARDLVNKTLTVNAEDLQPWQKWYIDHIYCGGTFEMLHSRKGPSLICSCKNAAAYRREAELVGSIMQLNRHSSYTGVWFGPDPEPRPAGPDCGCAGCVIFYA